MMIIYFSATGNNKYIATRISKQTNDSIQSMIQLVKDDDYIINLEEDETLGIITPTYFWGLPSYVEEYLSNITINANGNNYIYHISSYGTSTGYSSGYVREYLQDINIKLNASYSVKMADTWTPSFDLSSQEKIDKFNQTTEDEIDAIIEHIQSHDDGDYSKNKKNKILSNIAQIFYDRQRKTSHLHVLDTCTGCGLCEKNCPISAIKLNDEKIEWIYERCVMCLRCLHLCPQFSIQYDNRTNSHGQYRNPHIKDID